MNITWTRAQKQRLLDLNAAPEDLERHFKDHRERDAYFQNIEPGLVEQCRNLLDHFRVVQKQPSLCRLEYDLARVLTGAGFAQVATPAILSKGLLAKMSIEEGHPLFKKVFWLDSGKCLRPMLAPNLYFILKDLLRLWPRPVRIFEIGSCFRKESEGAHHLNEFTMLNLVEMGQDYDDPHSRLCEMADMVLQVAGVKDYSVEGAESEVYGNTVDFTAGFELGSGAYGPHPLDSAWDIADPWAGIGFGLERLVMARKESVNIKREGRSLTYLDGVRLNV